MMSQSQPLLRLQRLLSVAVAASLLIACSKPDYRTLAHGDGVFSDLRGRYVLINYWAAWCKPCIEELPELNAFSREQADRAAVFAVNYDGVDLNTLQRQATELNIEFPVLLDDPADQLGYERPRALPSTFIIAPDGSLKTVLLGPQTQASLLAALDGNADPSVPAPAQLPPP